MLRMESRAADPPSTANDQRSTRKVIVGVSGSIAAYKAVLLVRLLVKAGAEVRVLMTPAAMRFVSPLTFSTLSKREVLTDVVSEAGWNDHVELGLWADAYVIAPATANTLARLANGLCDTILAAVYLSARCPVLFAPAMDVDMWLHPSTRANIARLESYGNTIVPVGEGELASGLSGAGRLAEPEDIVVALEAVLSTRSRKPITTERMGDAGGADGTGDAVLRKRHYTDPHTNARALDGRLAGRRVLVTAGPTHEPIDPVRFIGNRSSGRQGHAIVSALLEQGAAVELVLGPVAIPEDFVALSRKHPARLRTHAVHTAIEMYDAATALWRDCHAGILVAAVADYRPVTVSDQKIKKRTGDGLSLKLVRNPDIAAALGEVKRDDQTLIGFALEMENGMENAQSKLSRKNLNAIVLNVHGDTASAFGGAENEVTILKEDGTSKHVARTGKGEVGKAVVQML